MEQPLLEAPVAAAVVVAGLPLLEALLEAPVVVAVVAEVVAERPLPAWQARPALPRFRLQK